MHVAIATCTNTVSNILLSRTYYNLHHITILGGQIIWGKLSKYKSREAGEEEHYVKKEVYVIECRVQSPAICYPAKSYVLILCKIEIKGSGQKILKFTLLSCCQT